MAVCREPLTGALRFGAEVLNRQPEPVGVIGDRRMTLRRALPPQPESFESGCTRIRPRTTTTLWTPSITAHDNG
jgi:hypothetical protein